MRKTIMIFTILGMMLLSFGVGFLPVKHAVYADKNDERRLLWDSKQSLTYWFHKGKKAHNIDIIETSRIMDRSKFKLSGHNYVGEYNEFYDTPVYFKVYWNSPLWCLNSGFAPDNAHNCFAIKYTEINNGTTKENYYEQPIIIDDWAPIYPIRRSGWLANKLLPEEYLTLWDFIGWRACW